MNEFIKVKDLEYIYDDSETGNVAIDGVTLEINKGDFVSILGHNGSGKSTFAKNLNALLLPTKGDVEVEGINTKDEYKVFDIRQKIGLVFQNPDNQLIASIVEDDVAFGPENLGVEPQEIRKRVDNALKVVRMSEFYDKAPHLLSGGQKQRIAIAGIIAMKPDCIVLDEATAMLDPRGRKEVMDTAYYLNKEHGITVIAITHFMEETIKSDKIFVMEEGKIILEGSPREVFSHIDLIESVDLEVPPMTKLANNLNKAGIDIDPNILSIEEMTEKLCQLKSKI